jgi:hypothetical protein
MNLLDLFPLYVPHSSGSDSARAAIAFEAINRTLPELAVLAAGLVGPKGVQETKSFPATQGEFAAAEALRVHLDREGSDKGGFHLYHYVYGAILEDRAQVRAVCEIGLGTNNLDVVSNMGAHGRPGASHRAFRDYLPNAHIYGGDVDARVLFQEDRITTLHVDQTVEASLEQFFDAIPDNLDLIIDDGLHSPFANLLTLRCSLPKIKEGGWVVVEDVQANSLPVWQTVAAFLPDTYNSHLLAGRGGMLFAVQRV